MQGIVQSVNTVRAGGFPRLVDGRDLHFEDAADFDETGGRLQIDDVVLDYVAADLETDVVTLAATPAFTITEDDFVAAYPPVEETYAVVVFGEDYIEADVPHALKAILPEGQREQGAGEAVILEEDGLSWSVVDVVGRRPSVDAYFIDNAEELLLADQKRLGEKLAENDAAIESAQTEIDAAEVRIDNAFSEIELKPDEAYVDAAKQQAIDAAAITAQQKADAARDAAITDAQGALSAAEAALQQAILDGDAAAIADAEAKIATAKAEAIDAAADDAAAKAAAAQSAAVDAAQDALHQAETDLYEAMDSGDAAAIADAEAKIATAKQEAITAAANDATAKAGEAMQKANAALTAAQSAQATADNAIRTYYSETPPWANGTTQPDDVLGDMWYKDSTGQAYRWNGTSWKVIQDASIGEALAAAQDAQTTADGKITAYYQPNEPLEGDEGDLWFDTDDDSAIHRRTGSQWLALLDPKALADAAEQAAKTAAAADATAKAEAAEAAAAAAAAADATAKANQAKADAEAAAQAYADQVAAGEGTGALAAAKEYAEQKAADAQAAAEAAAAADATAKAEAAEAAAAATAAADATAKADAAQAAAIAAAEAVEGRALSRGTDLVTNGTGYLGNNYNFPSLTYTQTDAPTGATGSFVSRVGLRTDGQTAENIPVDTTKTYKLSIAARMVEGSPTTGALLYTLFSARDAFNNEIRLGNIDFRPGTTTTLAEPLNPGDTTMTLTSTAGWEPGTGASHLKAAKWWDYVDPAGKAWPKETYTRTQSGNDFYTAINGNVITLRVPYTGPARPAGTWLSNGSNASSYFYTAWNGTQPTSEWETRTAIIAGTATAADGGNSTGTATERKFPPGTASIKIGWLTNYSPQAGANMAIAGISLSDASAAKDAADEAHNRAEEAEANAKAFATTRTDGLAKTLWSTSLPGTTTAPQNSVWYQVDSNEKIIAVFTQAAEGSSGNDWVARPITSEAIDNLDVGKLTAASGVVNDLVAQTFATKLANIIEANIGNLTVTGDTHLEDLVAQTIAGDTASFMQLTVDQILAGFLQAQWIITESGAIIAGDPEGARVEITSDGIRVFVLGYNGIPYEAVSMVNGEVSFAVVDQTRGMLGGISRAGNVTGQQAAFSKGVSVRGTDVLGQLGGSAAPGWMDLLARGILPGRKASSVTTAYRSAGTEAIYLRCKATLHPNRLYRVVSNMEIQCNTNSGVARQRIRMATGGAAATTSSPMLEQYTGTAGYSALVGMTTRVEDILSVDVVTKVEIASSYLGINNAGARANGGDLYIEDVGARGIDPGGGDDEAAKTLYTTTWRATASRGYSRTGATISGKENEINLWFFGDVAESAGVLFGGTAHEVDDVSEQGRTLPQALNGATIHRVELQVTNASWWNPDNTNMAFNTLSSSSLPSTKVVEGYTLVRDIPEGSAVWVDLDPSWFTNGTNRGITMGDKDGSLAVGGNTYQMGAGVFQGPGDPDAPLLRVTYSR